MHISGSGARRRAQGFTLFELIVTLMVASFLLVVAVPSFYTIRLNQQRSSTLTELLASARFARNEAARRARDVVICGADGSAGCRPSGLSWDDGLIVFVDINRDQRLQATDDILRRVHATRRGQAVLSNRRAFSFRPFSRPGTNGTIVVCDSRGVAAAAALVVSLSSRARIVNSATDTNWRCPT